jgi:hypothetical protein
MNNWEAEERQRTYTAYWAGVNRTQRENEQRQRQATEDGRRAAIVGAVLQMFVFGRTAFPDVLGSVLDDGLAEPFATNGNASPEDTRLASRHAGGQESGEGARSRAR